MPRTTKGNWDVRTYSNGANFDISNELTGANEGNGYYIDAQNMRPTSFAGDSRGVLTKIKGETLLYPNLDNRCP